MRSVLNPVFFFFFFVFFFFGYSFIYPIHYDCFPHHLTPISHYRLHPGPLHNSTLRCKVASLGNPAYDPSLKSFEPFVSPRLIHGICLRSTWPPWTHASSPLSLRVTHIFSPILYYYYCCYHYHHHLLPPLCSINPTLRLLGH